jgi:hypothetical protein
VIFFCKYLFCQLNLTWTSQYIQVTEFLRVLCVCVCVREREREILRERECVCMCMCDVTGSFIIQTNNAQHTLVSYFLVIYYQNVRSYVASKLTVLSSRFVDVALLMVIAWMINFGSCGFVYYLEFLSGFI